MAARKIAITEIQERRPKKAELMASIGERRNKFKLLSVFNKMKIEWPLCAKENTRFRQIKVAIIAKRAKRQLASKNATFMQRRAGKNTKRV